MRQRHNGIEGNPSCLLLFEVDVWGSPVEPNAYRL